LLLPLPTPLLLCCCCSGRCAAPLSGPAAELPACTLLLLLGILITPADIIGISSIQSSISISIAAAELPCLFVRVLLPTRLA
jgi:hypothetical protein